MKKIKLSDFISKLEKLKEIKGDVEMYPVYHDEFTDSTRIIKSVSVLSKAECEKFKGYNVTSNASSSTMFLVFDEQ